MKKMIHRYCAWLVFCLIVMLFYLTGCATGSAFKPITNVPVTKSLFYVYRKGRFLGAATESQIFINGKYLTTLRNSAYAPAFVSPGVVILSTLRRINWWLPTLAALSLLEQEQNERLRFNADSGKTYYVEWSVGDEMALVDESQGVQDIQGLKLSDMESNK